MPDLRRPHPLQRPRRDGRGNGRSDPLPPALPERRDRRRRADGRAAHAVHEREADAHRVDCGSSNGFTDNYEFLQAKAEEFAAEPLIPPPLVSGRDLIELGIKPSPRFKEILDAVQTEQLEGRILDREPALVYLKELAAGTSA